MKKNQTSLLIFSKHRYLIDSSLIFDKIIVSSSGCYGSCPINDVIIDKHGNIFYRGSNYNLKNGYFKGLISNKEFSKISERFQKASIRKMNSNYSSGWTDDETVTVSFVKAESGPAI